MVAQREAEVVVVGAGPVGLFTALCLAERGLKVEIFERGADTSAHSFAMGLHARSLRLLGEAGLGGELRDAGHPVARVAFYEGQEEMASLDLARLGGDSPPLLLLSQARLEDALVRRLGKKGVTVRFHHRVSGFEDDGSGVTVHVARLDRESAGYGVQEAEEVVVRELEVRCALLVGADGFHSLVRQRLGVDFVDGGHAQNFSVFEYETSDPLPGEVRVAFGPEGASAFWPIEEGLCRWGFETGPGTPSRPDAEALEGLLRERAPGGGPRPGTLRWASGVHFERRMARPFGRGRVWLAGDAAHLVGPAGVQSMNVGLREGRDLAGLMASVLRDGGSPSDLTAYAEGREAEWSRLLGLSGPPEVLPEAGDWVRKRAAALTACVPGSGADLDALLGQIGLRLP